MIVLSQKFQYADQDFEIFVKYDEVAKQPIEVKNINLHTHGNWYPVGTIMTKFFKDAVWKLITETDWEAVRIEKEKAPTIADFIHPILQIAASPFLVAGDKVKETYN